MNQAALWATTERISARANQIDLNNINQRRKYENFLAATILTLVATHVMASAKQIDIVECHTEHYSVIVSLVGKLRVAQVMKTSTSGQEIVEVYQSGISDSESRRIMSGESFGLSALTPVADGLKSIIVIADGQQSILVDDGNPTSAVCESAK